MGGQVGGREGGQEGGRGRTGERDRGKVVKRRIYMKYKNNKFHNT